MDSRNDAEPGAARPAPAGQPAPGGDHGLAADIRRLGEIRAALLEQSARFQAHLNAADPPPDPAQLQSLDAALLRISEEVAALALEARTLESTREELGCARSDLHESEATVQKLEGSLRRRFEELATLTAMLSEREAELEDAALELRRGQEKLRRIEQSFSWWVTAPLRSCAALLASLGLRSGLTREIALIEASDMFNAAWYLKNNPDVAASRMHPAEHYLRYGAREGRNPGPGFDTDWYVESNPDVDAEAVNPLVHYLRHGRHEGRTPRQ